MKTVKYAVEMTDTFGGEPNYCWTNRQVIELPAMTDADCMNNAARKKRQNAIRRAAKRSVGMSGVRGVWSGMGGTDVFRPHGMCRVVFVNHS
jgi:hypothetical protein